ncbi:hypothetical protein K432DRAFT_22276 [Lepidopterella palustris CBS 459.81]|uniref:Protein kinase domain-containing protein n=1 Tax=Lepidopterella palustris CBS 459.81 TaxID=1314670 RepID=A0A8E2JG52_9PEZI|nr:hypothetical protein K432DRAFT_22276 [Lepidopterella palustris CBS 459.81]
MTHQPNIGGFDFYTDAGRRKCYSQLVKNALERHGHKKESEEDQNETQEEGNDYVISESVLGQYFTKGKIRGILRCPCGICKDMWRSIPPENDAALADKIANGKDRIELQKLLATLSFMGGTFAMRGLDKHVCYTVDEAVEGMRDRDDLRRLLFDLFKERWTSELCCHNPRHNDALHCLEQCFREQLRSKAWILRIPTFQANNLTRQFRERQNMPFINQKRIGCSGARNDRAFFKFQIHPEYCDEKLQALHLFRKQLSISNGHSDTRERVRDESNILIFLKEIHHPNIAEVLFAYEEETPPRFSLVFKYYPYDLQKILSQADVDQADFSMNEDTAEQFPGSLLDHWVWKGFLGVLDAVAAVHEPQNYIKSIPPTSSIELVGGHFDIKPANIVIDENRVFYLTDFGQAYFKNVRRGEESNLTITPGTPNYRPPPHYKRQAEAGGTSDKVAKKKWTRAYDIWSLACVAAEILDFIIAGGPTAWRKFYEDRQKDDEDSFARFWKRDTNGTEVLKECVQNRLNSYKLRGDEYLNRVVKQIEEMFKTNETPSATAKACLQAFSASVEVNRLMFKGEQDDLVGGEGTHKTFEKMRTEFSTERVLKPLRCSLFVWRNTQRDKITLTVEFPGTDGGTIIMPNSTLRNRDDFIPVGLFDVDTLFDENRLRADGISLQCAFRNMHDGVIFHFHKRSDFYHLQGALTNQFPRERSEFRFRSCSLEQARSFTRRSWNSVSGHLQLWRQLTEEDYDNLYRSTSNPIIILPDRPRVEESSSSSSSVKKMKPTGKKKPITFVRLAFFLCEPESRTLIMVSLNEDVFHEKFDLDKPEMSIERKSSEEKIFAAVFEHPIKDAKFKATSSSWLDYYPGIPLSNTVLSQAVSDGKGFKSIKVQFWNMDDQRRFREMYQKYQNG